MRNNEMHIHFVLWLCCITNVNAINIITIYPDSPCFNYSGYNNTCMSSNGELFVIKNCIHNYDTVFDVGANIGEWSDLVLEWHPSVSLFAFEPIPFIFEILQKKLGHINCYNKALSNSMNLKSFIYYDTDLEKSQLSSFFRRPSLEDPHSLPPSSIDIETDTLDNFCIRNNIKNIDFLKIDTEGSELHILQGAQNLLFNNSIGIIQFEYGGTYKDAGIYLKDIYDLLSVHHYCIYRILPFALVHIYEWNDFLEHYQYANYLAIAPKKLSSLHTQVICD